MELKYILRKFAILIGLLLGSIFLHAQKNYAVMVTDAKTGNAIVGASILIKSTGKTVETSGSGNAVIAALPEDSLKISFKGYKDREISLLEQSVAISIVMYLKPLPVATKPKKKRN